MTAETEATLSERIEATRAKMHNAWSAYNRLKGALARDWYMRHLRYKEELDTLINQQNQTL